MTTDLELLSVGDATMDVYITPTESEALCQLNDKDCLICFSYGDKIPVRTLDFSVGGNAANNAVGAARLGIKTGILSSLGGDTTGRNIYDQLRDEGVDLVYTRMLDGVESNYSTVVVYSGERTIFTYHAKKEYQFPEDFPLVPWVYLTSMAEGFEDFYLKLSRWAKTHPETKLAFNPGSRQLRAGIETIKPVLESTYLVYVNRQEAEKITGFGDSHDKDRELLSAMSQMGPKVSVITDGSNGSFVYDGERFLRAGALPIDAYERTGAGDSFGSGMIAALIKGKPLEEALVWGAVNASSVIGYMGPQKGLLTEEKMPEWLERAKSCGVGVSEL